MRNAILSFFLMFASLAKAQWVPFTDPVSLKVGFEDYETGSPVLPCIYDGAFAFRQNTALVYTDSTYFVINKTGKKLCTFPRHPMKLSPEYDRYLFFDGHTMIVYDSLGKELLH